MNNYIKTRDLLLKIFEKKPDQLQVILNELHLAMKSKSSNLTTSFLKNYLDFNNQNAIILLWNGFNTNIILNMTAYDTDNNRVFYLKLINFQSYIIKNGRFLSLKETHDSI
ncbi:Uncharacterized protein FWK35_00036752, partial [Aphis craccivora]